MKRIAIWALPLVLIATFAAQGFAQAAAQEQPKWKDNVEYKDFMAVFDEKDFVKKAIAAWTGDSPQGAEYRKLYVSELDKVKVAYSGEPSLSDRGDYVRIDGPRVWIEFSTQGSDHVHTI